MPYLLFPSQTSYALCCNEFCLQHVNVISYYLVIDLSHGDGRCLGQIGEDLLHGLVQEHGQLGIMQEEEDEEAHALGAAKEHRTLNRLQKQVLQLLGGRVLEAEDQKPVVDRPQTLDIAPLKSRRCKTGFLVRD